MSSVHPHLASPSKPSQPGQSVPHSVDDEIAELQLDGEDDDSLHPPVVEDTGPVDLEADDDAYSPQHQVEQQPPQPAPLPPAPPPPPPTAAQSATAVASSSPRTSLSSRSAAKEREHRVILPITAAPITRHNQDDTVVGIQPHHVDFDESGAEEEDALAGVDGAERGEIWYEAELDSEQDDEDEEELWRAPAIDTQAASDHDREVSDIMSRTPSYSQQRAKELAIVAAIKAEKERYPGQIISSPPSVPNPQLLPSPTTHSSSATATAHKASKPAAVASDGSKSPTFSYPGGEAATAGGGMHGTGVYGDTSEEKSKVRGSTSSVSPRTAVTVHSGAIDAAVALAAAVLRCGAVRLVDV